jgi:hypothetical protein
MPYVFTQAPGNIQKHDELRKWVEDEFKRVAQASAESDALLLDARTRLTSLEARVTALEVLPYKAVQFTRVLSVASGNQAITGVGFAPRAIMFQTGISGGATWLSFGMWQGGINTAQEIALNAGGTLGEFYQPGLAGIQRDNAAGSNYGSFVVNSSDPDGFTLAWTKGGTPTLTASVNALCLR